MPKSRRQMSAKFKKMFGPGYIILGIERQQGNCVDLDEVAPYEPPHRNPSYLQIQIFSSVSETKIVEYANGQPYLDLHCCS